MLTVNHEGPSFNKGDLVVLQDADKITTLGGLGVIVSDPVLVFINDWENISEFPSQFWCYDVYADTKLFRQVPEQMLRSLKHENEIKNIKGK